MNPGEKFKAARKKARATRQEIMAHLGLSYSQVNQAENNVNISALKTMIDHYGKVWAIPEAWFFDGKDNSVPTSTAQEVLYPIAQLAERPSKYQFGDVALLPLWKSVLASDGMDCEYAEEELIPEPVQALFLDAEPEHFFLAQIVGPSLEDMAYTGDRLLVKRTPRPSYNTLVMARPPQGNAVCKVLRPGKAQPYRLCSYNRDCPDIEDVTGWIFVGEVRAIFLNSAQPPKANIIWDYHRPLRIPS